MFVVILKIISNLNTQVPYPTKFSCSSFYRFWDLMRTMIFVSRPKTSKRKWILKKWKKKILKVLSFSFIPKNFRKTYPDISEKFCRQKGVGEEKNTTAVKLTVNRAISRIANTSSNIDFQNCIKFSCCFIYSFWSSVSCNVIVCFLCFNPCN